MSTEQKVIALRDEFEDHARYMALEGREVDLNWQTWKAAHAKYAPRWLPIDEAAKDGYRKLLGAREPNGRIRVIGIGVWELPDLPDEEDLWLPLIPESFLIKPTHYMPIADAPEKA